MGEDAGHPAGDGGAGGPKIVDPLRARFAQLVWIVDHLDDIDSDLSAFHRIDDLWSMPAPRFFKLAWRLPAYAGVMQSRALAEQQRDQPSSPAASARAPSDRRGQEINPGTRASLMAEPAFAGLISFG